VAAPPPRASQQEKIMSSVSAVKNVLMPVAALLLVGALSGCATFGEAVGKCDSAACSADARLTSDVQMRLEQNPEFGADTVHVQAIDKVVYLNGTLSNGEQRADAELSALKTPGVTQVVNDIAVTK
jgi:osmotically-inducible protein OsmY